MATKKKRKLDKKESAAAQQGVKKLMHSRGIHSGQKLADMLGLSRPALSMMISGYFKATPERIASLSHILGVDTEEMSDLLRIQQEWRRVQAKEIYQDMTGASAIRKTFLQVYDLLSREILIQYHQSPPEKQHEVMVYLSEILQAYSGTGKEEYSTLARDLVDVLQSTFVFPALEEVIASTGIPRKSELRTALEVLCKITSGEAFGKVLDDSYDKSKERLNETYQKLDLVNRIDFIDKLERLVRRYEQPLPKTE